MPSPESSGRRELIAFAAVITVCLAGGVLIARGYLTVEWLNTQFESLQEF